MLDATYLTYWSDTPSHLSLAPYAVKVQETKSLTDAIHYKLANYIWENITYVL